MSSSTGNLFSSSISSGETRSNAAADSSSAINGAISSSSFGIFPAFGFSSSGRALNLAISSGTDGPATIDSSSSARAAFSAGGLSSTFIKPTPLPPTPHSVAYWELVLGFEDPCLGYRNRTNFLLAASRTVYEAAYTGCRYRAYSSSVLTVRSNLTTSKEQKKDLNAARAQLKSVANLGLLSDDIVALDGAHRSGGRLSGGAIAGIVVGVLLFVIIVAGVAVYFYVSRSRGSDPEKAEDKGSDYTMMKDQLVPDGRTIRPKSGSLSAGSRGVGTL